MSIFKIYDIRFTRQPKSRLYEISRKGAKAQRKRFQQAWPERCVNFECSIYDMAAISFSVIVYLMPWRLGALA
jgi:hypothetical protein